MKYYKLIRKVGRKKVISVATSDSGYGKAIFNNDPMISIFQEYQGLEYVEITKKQHDVLKKELAEKEANEKEKKLKKEKKVKAKSDEAEAKRKALRKSRRENIDVDVDKKAADKKLDKNGKKKRVTRKKRRTPSKPTN